MSPLGPASQRSRSGWLAPPNPVAPRSTTSAVRSRREHECVAGELDHRVGSRVVRRVDFGEAIGRREATLGRGLQRFEQSMHAARQYVRAMRVDVMTVPKPLREMGPLARSTIDAGFTGMLLTEGGRTAFPAATAAALAAPGLELSTGVAVAFPRSPMIAAPAGVGTPGTHGRVVPARTRHPGPDTRGPALRRRVRPSRSTPA